LRAALPGVGFIGLEYMSAMLTYLHLLVAASKSSLHRKLHFYAVSVISPIRGAVK
jgi:hypothetical protein